MQMIEEGDSSWSGDEPVDNDGTTEHVDVFTKIELL